MLFPPHLYHLTFYIVTFYILYNLNISTSKLVISSRRIINQIIGPIISKAGLNNSISICKKQWFKFSTFLFTPQLSILKVWSIKLVHYNFYISIWWFLLGIFNYLVHLLTRYVLLCDYFHCSWLYMLICFISEKGIQYLQ